MKNTKRFVAVIGVIIVSFLLLLAVYYYAGQPAETNKTPTQPVATPTPVKIAVPDEDAITALDAITIIRDIDEIKEIMADNKNMSFVTVSSDVCVDGLSTSWTIILSGDDKRVSIQMFKGEIISLMEFDDSPAKLPAIDFDHVIDSDVAWTNASSALSHVNVGRTTMILKASGKNQIWDVAADDGNNLTVVRLDAVSGKILNQTTIGG